MRHVKEAPSRSTIVNSLTNLRVGDIIAVEYNNSSTIGHLMMITEGYLGYFKVSYHSTNTKDKPLVDFMMPSSHATNYSYIQVK